MTPFKHILVATDFSEPAVRALDVAISLAMKYQTRLTLFHVFVFSRIEYGFPGYNPDNEYKLSAQKALDAAVAKERKRFPTIRGRLVEGQAAAEILHAITELRAGLVVMGTHGHNWISRALLGSVAEKVVRASVVPVLTVPALTPKQIRNAKAGSQVGRERWTS